MELLINPIIISVILLCILCLCRVNVLLALLVSAVVAGKVAGMHAGQIMDVFINGMGQNSETALSYILLGTFAAAMAHTGLADVLAYSIYSGNNSAIDIIDEQIKTRSPRCSLRSLFRTCNPLYYISCRIWVNFPETSC